MAGQSKKFGDYLSATRDWLSDFWKSVKPDPKQMKEFLVLFGTAIVVIALLYVLLFAASFLGPRHAYGAESISNAEFDGMVFKTRYQDAVNIQTHILVQMDNETRVLNIVLKDPTSAKFRFLFKITPIDYRSWVGSIRDHQSTAMFTWSGSAYFTQGPKIIRVGLITLIIDIGSNRWLDDYKDSIEDNFKNCKMAPDPKGDLDIVCQPLWISAKINRIERSISSPDLPKNYIFPHLDYVDIYIEVTSISKTRPKN